VTHGRAAAGKIAWLVDHYRARFRGCDGSWKEGCDPDSRRARVAARLQEWVHLYPDGYDEVRGIADGAGLPVADVVELNVAFELGSGLPAQACSVYGFQADGGRVLMGKSDDLWLAELGCNAVHRVTPTEGLASVQLHYVGTIWTSAAMNRAGFGFGMTGLTGRIRHPGGFPGLFLLHMMAERCRSVREAEALLAGFQVEADGMSLIAGDASGDVAVIQKHAAGQTATRPDRPGEAVWQTNHCRGALSGADHPECSFLANSRAREALLEERDATVPRSLEGLQALYRTHGAPCGICQHGEGGLHTDSAVLLDPCDRAMWATEGYPCEQPFGRHPVP
jgi:isopenicillin-N N-acyltransferase-like protein